MNTLLRLAQAALVLLCLLLSAGLILTVSLTWFAWHEKPAVESTIRAIGVMAREGGLAAKNVQSFTNAWNRASDKQTSAITSAAQSVTVGMGAVSGAARQLSRSVSAVEKSSTALLNESTQAVREQNQQTSQTQEQVRANLRGLQGVEEDSRRVLRDADSQIANPAIGKTIDHVEQGTKNLASTTGHLDGIVASGERTTVYYEKKLTTPVGFWKTFIGWILDTGYKVRAVIP